MKVWNYLGDFYVCLKIWILRKSTDEFAFLHIYTAKEKALIEFRQNRNVTIAILTAQRIALLKSLLKRMTHFSKNFSSNSETKTKFSFAQENFFSRRLRMKIDQSQSSENE